MNKIIVYIVIQKVFMRLSDGTVTIVAHIQIPI